MWLAPTCRAVPVAFPAGAIVRRSLRAALALAAVRR